MTASLLFLCWVSAGGGAPVQKPTLYQQIFATTTGQNGFEEYIRAADLINTPAARAYIDWRPGQEEFHTDPALAGAELAAQAQLVKLFNAIRLLNFLQVRTQFGADFAK